MQDFRAIIQGVLIIAILASGGRLSLARAAESSLVVEAARSAEITEVLKHLEPLWESMKSDVVSCEAHFRKYFRVKPIVPLTHDQVQVMFQGYNLGEHPELTPNFLREVSGPDAKVDVPTRHLFIQGPHRKHDLGRMTHVQDAHFGFVYDGDNKQVHIYERGRIPMGTPGLEWFRCPMHSRRETRPSDRVEREGNLLRLFTVAAPTSQRGELRTTDTIDWATGILLNRLRELDGDVIQEVTYSGLVTFAGGITIPRCALTARYSKGHLQTLDLALLNEARLNETIPESMFVVSKPEGWPLLDFREQANGAEVSIPQERADDVRALIPAYALNPPSQSISRPSENGPLSLPKRVLLVLNGLALIVLGVWMWRRASLKELNH